MRNAAADNVAACSDEGNDPYNMIVADLVALIGHVQASLRLIESEIAREALLAEQDAASNIFVLDDVMPRYMVASTALKACDVGLGAALGRLLDSETPTHILN
ncbi:hypothetical protein MTX26_02350 [Bradyrhizobium sp. ISRA443]|uniref:hypothetical protein n=1 Tax=unclassified Bradyrhizobium TaxID=2631580 RepID=UPI00247A323E|nr:MULTISPECIES: hypothetical protein [unclassified Bradyrhizobium]WGR99738.1 hypothetical protein MTX23_02350 [Bradyrhizobium sp. ISRA436]WGS06628.1 hypothetical protein MTX18_02350 [Bradyrhizobium sp. ISRA437]WGS13512.1 hypothetical protein MTX26_02350 [Bradyrhizobium sp. ISRA443]